MNNDFLDSPIEELYPQGKDIKPPEFKLPAVYTIAGFDKREVKKYQKEELEWRTFVRFHEMGADRELKLNGWNMHELGSMFPTLRDAIGQQVIVSCVTKKVGNDMRDVAQFSAYVQTPANQQMSEEPDYEDFE